ncbi:hypothetical protein [Nocardia sp. NPDC020380]|uniref:hypothetical protein n=1 Tax=Nocardia sp. NPDC020380 TaxID=3364309 RepID=UPI003787FB89
MIQELSAAQRDLASLYAVIPDSNERDVTGNSLMIGLPTAIVSQLLLLQPIPLGKDLGIGVYIVSIVFIAHVLGPRRRMRSRRLLYGRFGGRPDTPALPSMSRWPFVSRRLGQIRLNKWLIQTLGGAPRPPENITDEEISKLTDLIDQWHANPWWRRVLRAWIITAGAVRRMTRSLPSHEPDSAYAPPE